MRNRALLIPMTVIALTACNGQNPGDQAPGSIHAQPLSFIDITQDAGIDFLHESGVKGDFLMPEIMGSGAALFDYDNDDDLDVYLINSGSTGGPSAAAANRLFEQTPGGRFVDVTKNSGLGDTGYGMGAALGDIDNDGDLDIFVSNYGPDKLYRNEGDGRFTDITSDSGIEASDWSTSASFCDLDRNGLLDLVVATYVTNEPPRACTSNTGTVEYCGPKAYRGLADRLFMNQGNGRFQDAGRTSGFDALRSKALGVICFDFDADHWPDVLIANDGEKNHLWINQRDGTFNEKGVAFGVALNLFGKPEASMGIAFGDVNNDLSFDALITHLDQETNTLYTSEGNQGLLDVTAAAGLGVASMPYTGFGADFLDTDHDGDLDLLVANGKVRRSQGQASSASAGPYGVSALNEEYAEPNLLFMNAGAGSFVNGCDRAGEFCSRVEIGRGLITGDVDRDGDLDVLLSNNNGRARLYRNDIEKDANWMIVSAVDPELKRHAIGARVEIRTGEQWQARPVLHSKSYLSAGEADVHFGLGHAERADEVRITWPDGRGESFGPLSANAHVTLLKGGGVASAEERRPIQ